MTLERYLERIDYTGSVKPDAVVLTAIHECHLRRIPFENVDCYFQKPFDLHPASIYEKVVINGRGGFCYEVNLLFHWLLDAIGFSASIISARIINDGKPGPPYDHMCVHVRAGGDYLCDVGYGDLFAKPLKIEAGIQYDGRNYFKIEPTSDGDFLLSMSADGIDFQVKYSFRVEEVQISSFDEICHYKQTSPESYFVRNLVCTLPTPDGRVTLFNDKLIEKSNGLRTEATIADGDDLKQVLRDRFGINI